jgi:hypothetical protein
MSFLDDRHILYVGWVLGIAVRNGLHAEPIVQDGLYTDAIAIDMGGRQITIVVPPPPDEWKLGEDDWVPPECPACSARAEMRSRVWWETAHDPGCAWLADADSEPYA